MIDQATQGKHGGDSVLLQLKLENGSSWHSLLTDGGDYADRTQKLFARSESRHLTQTLTGTGARL